MITAFAALALQGMISMPISTSLSIAPPYERANVSASPVSTASTSLAMPQLEGGPKPEQLDEAITVRRGSSITQERAPKGKPAK